MRISDWSSDVCSSDLLKPFFFALARNGVKRRDHANKLAGILLAGWGGEEEAQEPERLIPDVELREILIHADEELRAQMLGYLERWAREPNSRWLARVIPFLLKVWPRQSAIRTQRISRRLRSEEHTSELQSLMRISYSV